MLKRQKTEMTKKLKLLRYRSSLIYNTSARHARHECDTSDTNARLVTRVTHQRHECDTSATRVLHERHDCDRSAARTTRVRHKRKILNFGFENDTGKNIFSHPYIYYMLSERLQGEEQFHSKNYVLEISRFHVKMRLKSAPQKLNFLIAKALSKSCTLDCSCKCPCTLPHNYVQ